jgi:hypothetical protein
LDNAVEMIRHDDESVEFDPIKAFGHRQPAASDDFSCLGALDIVVGDLAENALSVVRTDGDEIRAGQALVIVLEPYRSSAARHTLG